MKITGVRTALLPAGTFLRSSAGSPHIARRIAGGDPAAHDTEATPIEYGFLYSANIIEQWIRPAGKGVDILWNAATWDPYRVILLRTRIE